MTTRPICIVVAMASELRHLIEAATVEREIRGGIWLERRLTVGGRPVVAVLSGIGLINAAAATERLIDAHNPAAVLNFGCAGAHRREIMPGDVVIGDRVVLHSAVHVLAGGDEHYKGFGYAFAGEEIKADELPCDPTLVAIARSATENWVPDPWPPALGWPATVDYRDPVTGVGAVASADVWTQSQARLDVLHGRHGSLCEDMEAAAVAQVCALHGVPFLTIKDISNNEYHAATDLLGGADDFPMSEVGKRAAALTLRVLEAVADL
ncbi:MAG: 5'-methylthioadenosine/S-adenosylhomocysteine nucleosidase [Thermomicrobiales bacterium]